VLLVSSSLRRFGCASWRVESAECSRLSGIGAANKGGQARANGEEEPLSRSGSDSRLTCPRSPGPNAPFTMTSMLTASQSPAFNDIVRVSHESEHEYTSINSYISRSQVNQVLCSACSV
jgi:hypothetical protein